MARGTVERGGGGGGGDKSAYDAAASRSSVSGATFAADPREVGGCEERLPGWERPAVTLLQQRPRSPLAVARGAVLSI